MHPSPAATRAVREWTRAALVVEGGTDPSSVTPRAPGSTGEPTTMDLVAAVSRQRVAEVLHAHAGRIGLPVEIADAVARKCSAERRMHAVRMLEISRIQRLLEDVGVRWLLVKGPALAVQTTGDPRARGLGDIDLFVSPEDVVTVQAALEPHGWAARAPGPVPGSWCWDYMIDKGYEITLDGPGSRIDLHWRLDPTHAALPSFEQSWEERIPIDIGGLVVPTVELREALTYACHHAAKDEFRLLRSLVDVHRLARRPEAWHSLDPSRVDLAALRVTQSCVGLPDGIPGRILHVISGVSSTVVNRAHAAQERPVTAIRSVPGEETFTLARYRLSASHTVADARRTVLASLAPVREMDDIEDVSARTAVPRLVWRRLRWVARRVHARLRGHPDGAASRTEVIS